MRELPRELNVRFALDWRTGNEHNVLEVCESKYGVSYVMAQDSEIHKELDAYKLRAHLLKKKNNKLEEELKRVSNYVGRLEARVDFLEKNEMPKAVIIQRLIEKFIHGLENDVGEVAKEIKELMAQDSMKDEPETEEQQDET